MRTTEVRTLSLTNGRMPNPHRLIYTIVLRFFNRGPTADIGCGSGRDAAWLAGHRLVRTGKYPYFPVDQRLGPVQAETDIARLQILGGNTYD
jgi:hypothetical protein